MRASITLTNELGQLAQLQVFASGFVLESRLSDEERARLFIILEELFTNAVQYGYARHASQGEIKVTLRRKDGRLVIDFIDDGRPFDPLSLAKPDLDAAGEKRVIGGLGVHIVRSLVDEAGYCRENGRNHLRLVRRIGKLSGAGG